MSEITTYSPDIDNFQHDFSKYYGIMVYDPDGLYVSLEDHDKIVAELKQEIFNQALTIVELEVDGAKLSDLALRLSVANETLDNNNLPGVS